MESLIKKAKRHFENIDNDQFTQDWIDIVASSCSSGFAIDELIEFQKKFKYSIDEEIPDKLKFNFNNLKENPSFTSDSLFLYHEQRCSLRF